jgi:DNA-binding MarR family transcriptional regulator
VDAKADASIGPSDKRVIEILLRSLKPLINLRSSIPLPFVTTFLMVALDEGKGVGAYAKAHGMHRAAMSRYLHGIGDRHRNGGPGLGLVSVEAHPSDPRRRQVFLTSKGRSLAKAIFQQMRKASSHDH